MPPTDPRPVSHRPVYHRLAGAQEESEVVRTGQLWGKSPRMNQGNAEPAVKAYLGPLPKGETGYSFVTEIPPGRERNFPAGRGAIWCEGDPGVQDHPELSGVVLIAVEVV